LLRLLCVSALLVGLAAGAIGALGCQPPSVTTRERGETDRSGYALVHAEAPSVNHHYSAEVALSRAPEGTYVLLFSNAEPVHRGWFSIPADDPALRCASSHGRGCVLGASGAGAESQVVAVERIGPGGTGVLRAAFDVGAGGWFTLVRLEGAEAAPASFEARMISEALVKGEAPHRFVIEQVRSYVGTT
jgi:hypothetical protein